MNPSERNQRLGRAYRGQVEPPPAWAMFCLMAGHQVEMVRRPKGKIAWVCLECGGGGRCDECGQPR